MGDLGRRLGMAMTIAASGALAGPPISGAIYSATGGFEAVGYYAGASIHPFVARSAFLITEYRKHYSSDCRADAYSSSPSPRKDGRKILSLKLRCGFLFKSRL